MKPHIPNLYKKYYILACKNATSSVGGTFYITFNNLRPDLAPTQILQGQSERECLVNCVIDGEACPSLMYKNDGRCFLYGTIWQQPDDTSPFTDSTAKYVVKICLAGKVFLKKKDRE